MPQTFLRHHLGARHCHWAMEVEIREEVGFPVRHAQCQLTLIQISIQLRHICQELSEAKKGFRYSR
jgi:hypothetical protein